MKLKIFILPFFLVMILILSIGYIKPDFDIIFEKKAEINTQDASLKDMDSVLNNISTLNDSLDRNAKSEQFMLQYLPYVMNQDQTIDAFGYLASQSGLVVSDLDLKKIDEAANTKIAPDGSIVEDTTANKVKTFQLKGSVLGTYENIKTFYDRLSHISRFQNIQSFSIEKKIDSTSPQDKGTVSDLKGTFVVAYGYLPKKSVLSALAIPVFLQSELDFSGVALLKEKITYTPTLGKDQVGKPNPFQ
ncbi:MAG: hypothetical protein CO143_02605 [Candidatus Moranbacteria bacterium CG_4_9_14_3_um_filter_45_14]|nr:MAG: hypothetical protein AUK19_00845 [Candidatus Moranbacteria bacterium CG2_30_45_14]PJA85172.1 MAG: hypothetical protein CO143_02605 [Candidatus Moranbacteria bacterium CG_4_9_14_3_um_filter_45_14]